MTHRENTLRAWRFQYPEWIPVTSGFPYEIWQQNDRNALDEIMLSHPRIWPNYRKHAVDPANFPIRIDHRKGQPYTDGWGCVWETAYDGMVGAVTSHPLADWERLAGFQPPDPDISDGQVPIDWEMLRQGVRLARERGELTGLYLPHGHTYLRIQDLRGYTNLVYDMADEEPRLLRLIEMAAAFNQVLIQRFIALQPDIIGIPEDLGMQNCPLITPGQFRRYFKPSYLRLTGPVKAAGILVHEHSDGYIMDLADDLLECGGDVLNLQDLVNGIDAIRKTLKGRVAIDLDIDRQQVTAFGTPGDIDDLIHEAVDKLGSREGGLSLTYQPWNPTPLENLRAVYDACEKYCTRYR